MKYTQLLTQTNAFKVLHEDASRHTPAHCYLLYGADNLALDTLAKMFFMQLLCKDGGCMSCNTCRRIKEDVFADIINLPKSQKTLKDDVEEFIEKAANAPVESDYKIFCFHNFSEVVLTSQHKMLKTLEEPYKNVIIVLLASSRQNIFSMVQSRAKQVRVNLGTIEQVAQAIAQENSISSEQAREAYVAACNSLERAEALIKEPKKLEQVDYVFDMLANMTHSNMVLHFGARLSKDADFDFMLDLMQACFRDAICVKSGTPHLAVFERPYELKKIADNYSLMAMTKCMELIANTRKLRKVNCMQTPLSDSLLLGFLQLKSKYQD